MFKFFFKRTANKSSAPPAPEQAPQLQPRAASALARQQALAQAERLSGNEAAAADFILQCGFAEARLKAAHSIESKPQLERMAQAMRNSDRRVARLMQQRLDALLQQAAATEKAEKCITEAQRLAAAPQLMLNQVADLDRAWQAAGDIASSMRHAFDSLRAVLRERLEAQARLQRSVLDMRARLQMLIKTATDAPAQMQPEQIAQALDELAQQLARHCTAPEAPSLPQHLLAECGALHTRFRQSLASLETRRAAIVAHQQMLAGWESAPVADLDEDSLMRAWHGLPAMHADDATPIDARFDALADRIRRSRKPKEGIPDNVKADDGKQVAEALDKLEKALESGSLQSAAEQDRMLRSLDLKSLRLPAAQTARLAKARNEMSRLQSWAKWGGNISREELLKAAEALPEQPLAIPELVKKVGSLRERWKSLDATAGPAAREAWEQFDVACTAAYAPAAAHFRKLADERQHNLEKAQAIIADVRQFAGTSQCTDADPAAVDWKAVAAYCARSAQLWRCLGTIDRKDKKSADNEFAIALRVLSEPLAAQQKIEIAHRENLIAEASVLQPDGRQSLDALRALQQRWQERAKLLPLERHDEQGLWRRFRSACDAFFEKRKETAQAADADRQRHLEEKEALCMILEAATDVSLDALPKAMRDSRDAWSKTGPVPRASERRIETRYEAAMTALQKRQDEAQRSAKAARFNALPAKLTLCRALEERIVTGGQDRPEPAQWRVEWQALPALSPEFELGLLARFEAAIAALSAAGRQYAALLEQNRATLAHAVLRLEIVMGIASPPALSRERLQLQVEVLQSSLKAGQKPVTPELHLAQLCSLPALPDPQLASRMDRLIADIRHTGT